MAEIRCERCGCKVEGKNYFTYCSHKKEFVCLNCERTCKNYSAKILPNGTHCFISYRNESYKYKLLASRIIAPEEDISTAAPKYEAEKRTGVLFEKFRTKAALYQNIHPDATEYRAQARVELAAMQRVILKRVMSDPKTKRLYEIFNCKVGETKDDKK